MKTQTAAIFFYAVVLLASTVATARADIGPPIKSCAPVAIDASVTGGEQLRQLSVKLHLPTLVRCDYDEVWGRAPDYFLSSPLRREARLCTYRNVPVVHESHRWTTQGDAWTRSYLLTDPAQLCPPIGDLEYVSVYATAEAYFVKLADYWNIASQSQSAFDEQFASSVPSRRLRDLLHGSPAGKNLKLTNVEPLSASDYHACAMFTCHLLWLSDGNDESHSVAVSAGWISGYVILSVDPIIF